jgi:transposase
MNTQEPRLLSVESVADLPVLWATLQRLDFVAHCNRHFPTPLHWKGPLTPGQILAVWLLYILSRGDHRLNHLQPWVAQHQGTLTALLGQPITPTDAHDDRLADLLGRLGHHDTFHALERDLNCHTIRVYQLPTDTIRIDATTANSYAEVLSKAGLLQFGHSKDDPTRPQFKVMAAALDPLGMPLTMAVVPGNSTDDPLYVPAIHEVQQALGKGGRTYVGDCKMAALATRAYLASTRDFYLCPLSENQLSREKRRELLRGVFAGEQPLQAVYRPGREGQPDELVAEGFVVEVPQQDRVDGKTFTWTERRWLVRSQAYARAGQEALEKRLAKAQAALADLPVRKRGKKQLFYRALHEAAEAVVKAKGVEGLLSWQVHTIFTDVRKRAYAGRPARQEMKVSFGIEVARNEAVIAEQKREMGWQVYATNGPGLVLAQVVWAYRGQYRIEDDWSRLKGRSLGLTPLYLQDEGRITGLVYLLSVALRVLTLIEWVVREGLRKEEAVLRGLYAGQPGRKTARPSTELLLAAFATVRVSVVAVGGQVHVLLSGVTELHRRLLSLLNMPPDLYENVVQLFPKPPPNRSEP